MPGCTNKRLVVRLGICGRIHAQDTGCQSGVRSCSMPGLSAHLVQELNASTVAIHLTNQSVLLPHCTFCEIYSFVRWQIWSLILF